MSHEIRTPMNAIIGLTTLLLDTPLNDAQQELARTICRSTDGLLSIVNDVLDFAKIEAGRLHINAAPFSLRATLADSIELLAPRAREKNLALSLRFAPGFPSRLVGDPDRIRQIMLNLVNNAVKFTERGWVRVDAQCSDVRSGVAQVRIAVSDSGPGIEPALLANIFDRFTQVDSSASRRHEGTGLGLAISKRLVELMGGAIGVESTPGVGSTFTVSLELPEHTAAQPHQPHEPRLPAFAGARVLLVEDNHINQHVQRRLLEKPGCVVDVAANGNLAVDMAAVNHYAAILMDCQMPEMDGFEATRRIRALGHGAGQAPIIAVTARALDGDREECLAAGMDDYIGKPVRQAELARLLAKWVPRRRPV